MAEVTEDLGYKVDKVQSTRIAADKIDETFKATTIDLTSATLGGRILSTSNEWFADASNLLTPTPAIRDSTRFVHSGAWYDGWETRRHNTAPFDYAIIKLGVASGTISGIEVDTAYFNGNHAPFISVEGVFADSDEEVVGWKGDRGKWEPVLGIQECGPSQRFGWRLAQKTKPLTHVRLNMYPDGGIARFRLYGTAVPVFPSDPAAVFDLAAAVNGGVALACSDQHFGTIANLILPGRGKDMSDGWETARTRGKGHVDWAIIKLGARGVIERVVVDTAHFRGNYPQAVRVEAICWMRDGEPENASEGWEVLVQDAKTQADLEHDFPSANQKDDFTHVKLVIIPDGGVKRIRVFGRRELEA